MILTDYFINFASYTCDNLCCYRFQCIEIGNWQATKPAGAGPRLPYMVIDDFVRSVVGAELIIGESVSEIELTGWSPIFTEFFDARAPGGWIIINPILPVWLARECDRLHRYSFWKDRWQICRGIRWLQEMHESRLRRRGLFRYPQLRGYARSQDKIVALLQRV